jgi:hypothetical protein
MIQVITDLTGREPARYNTRKRIRKSLSPDPKGSYWEKLIFNRLPYVPDFQGKDVIPSVKVTVQALVLRSALRELFQTRTPQTTLFKSVLRTGPYCLLSD